VPIPIQRPWFHQGLIDAFSIRGKTPFVLDETYAPVVNIMDLEKSPYSVFPGKEIGFQFQDIFGTANSHKVLYLVPKKGTYLTLNAVSVDHPPNLAGGSSPATVDSTQLYVTLGLESAAGLVASFTESFRVELLRLQPGLPLPDDNAALNSASSGFVVSGEVVQPSAMGSGITTLEIPARTKTAPSGGTISTPILFDPPIPLYTDKKQNIIVAITNLTAIGAAPVAPEASGFTATFYVSTYPENQ